MTQHPTGEPRGPEPSAGQPLWQPTAESLQAATITDYLDFLRRTRDLDFADYQALLRWSVTDLDGFWGSVWEYFGLGDSSSYEQVLADRSMPGARWFPGVRANFARCALRGRDDRGEPSPADAVAIVAVGESGSTREQPREITYGQLREQVAACADGLRALGIRPGDYVAGYLPNVPETVIGLLAAASLGAVWTVTSADLGANAAHARLEQVEPVVLIATQAYRYAGKDRDRSEVLAEIVAGLPSLRHVVLVDALAADPGGGREQPGPGAGSPSHEPSHEPGDGPAAGPAGEMPAGEVPAEGPAGGALAGQGPQWSTWEQLLASGRSAQGGPEELAGSNSSGGLAAWEFPVELPFDHPLWVLWSSGTTGAPKGIVHGHGGMALELLKGLALCSDVRPGDRYFFVTSTGWMVWNLMVGGLLVGATIVLYDGAPTHPDVDGVWRVAELTEATAVGCGAAYLLAGFQAGARPADRYHLSALRIVQQTASALPEAAWHWVSRDVRPGVWLQSISGGTDVCSAFAGANPLQAVYPGCLQGAWLGAALEAWDDDGHPVLDTEAELVVTAPMPSMPLRFVNDPQDRRYRDAYFDVYPGVWRHGDLVTARADGSFVVSGRSDATLNRHGIRMGSADIYAVVETLEGVAGSLVIGLEQPDGGYWMPLFVVPSAGTHVDDALRERIRTQLRSRLSPRHVPDEILEIRAVPTTINGKKLEVPVKRILAGADPAAVGAGAADPAALQWFAQLAEARRRGD